MNSGGSLLILSQVLKILLHVCGHGPPHFLTELRRNATFIQEVIGKQVQTIQDKLKINLL